MGDGELAKDGDVNGKSGIRNPQSSE